MCVGILVLFFSYFIPGCWNICKKNFILSCIPPFSYFSVLSYEFYVVFVVIFVSFWKFYIVVVMLSVQMCVCWCVYSNEITHSIFFFYFFFHKLQIKICYRKLLLLQLLCGVFFWILVSVFKYVLVCVIRTGKHFVEILFLVQF